jgi:hypothetical protein
LNFEFSEFRGEPQFLHDSRVFPACEPAVFFGLGARDDHFARCKDQSCGFRFSDSHDDGCEPFRVVFGVARVKGNGFEVELAVEIDRSNNVSIDEEREEGRAETGDSRKPGNQETR